MTTDQLIKRYQEESGNTVKDGKVYDSSGHYICEFSKAMANSYHDFLNKLSKIKY
jgi:hypothetical protein